MRASSLTHLLLAVQRDSVRVAFESFRSGRSCRQDKRAETRFAAEQKQNEREREREIQIMRERGGGRGGLMCMQRFSFPLQCYVFFDHLIMHSFPR